MVNQDKKGGNRMKNSTVVYLTLKEIRELRKVIIHYDLEKGETFFRDRIYNKLFDAEERIERMRVRAETEKGSNMTIEVEQLERIIENEIANIKAEMNDMSYERLRGCEKSLNGMVFLLSQASGTHYMWSFRNGLVNCGYPETIDN